MKPKIETKDITSLPVIFQFLNFSTIEDKKNKRIYNVVDVELYKTNSYPVDPLYKPISKLFVHNFEQETL